MTTPIKITIDTFEGYLADEIRLSDPAYFVGSKTIRKIVEKKNIPDIEYKYVKFVNDEWVESTKEYPKAKLLLSESWVKQNIPSMSNGTVQNTIEVAPSILELTDNEKFKNIDGEPMEITVRGEREYNKCFFRVKDVAECFESKYLRDTLADVDRGYQKDMHYKYFTMPKTSNARDTHSKRTKPMMYITYQGLVRFLFVSRNKNAELFQEWALKILFTVQMGTQDQKNELITDIAGCDAKTATSVLDTSVNKISCVYMFTIGHVKDLRTELGIDSKYDDSCYVIKYGKTEDLRKRVRDHRATFSKIKGSKLRLKYYAWMDKTYIATAEIDIHEQLVKSGTYYKYKTMSELGILTKEQLREFNKTYNQLSLLYGAPYDAMVSASKETIKTLEDKVKLTKSRCETKIEKLKRSYEQRIHELELELAKK